MKNQKKNNTESFSKKSYIYKGYGNLIQDPLYIAPEFIEKKYNNKVDIWGVGMVAYLLFVGEEPFKGSRHQIIYQISNKKIEYPSNLSAIKKDLLKKMLNKNPNERYEADDLLKEEYFHVENEGELGSEEQQEEKEFFKVINSMCYLTVGKNLRKSVISYIIARKLYKENDTKLRKIFESLDENHNGYIRKTYARLLSNDFKIITENTCQWFFNLDGIRIIRMCIFFKSRVQIPICSLSIGYINVLPIDILCNCDARSAPMRHGCQMSAVCRLGASLLSPHPTSP